MKLSVKQVLAVSFFFLLAFFTVALYPKSKKEDSIYVKPKVEEAKVPEVTQPKSEEKPVEIIQQTTKENEVPTPESIDDKNRQLAKQAQDQKELEDKLHACNLKRMINQLEVVTTPQNYRVVSFSLYGSNKRYTTGAISNVELAKEHYPGWKVRFYHDFSVPSEILKQLLEMGSELINVEKIGLKQELGGMFWRFLVVLDPRVDRFIIRDVDSRLNAREAAAVKEWIESKFHIHSMRDHRNHNYPLNGGMWGAEKGGIPHFFEKMLLWMKKDHYMADMDFLGTLWEDIKTVTLSHDSYFCHTNRYPNCRDFPTPRVGNEFVGSVPPPWG